MAEKEFIYDTETFYDQLDGQMILHHPRYLIFVERAQQLWFEYLLGAPRFDWKNFPDMYLVVRKLEAEYLLPVDGVVPIRVAIFPLQIRAATLRIGFRIESPDQLKVYCRGERLNCKVDPATHEPRIWSDALLAEIHKIIEARSQNGFELK